MGLFSRLFGAPDVAANGHDPDFVADAGSMVQFGVDVPAELLEAATGGGSIAQRISRREALQVPAVLRARNLIAGTLGTKPVHVRDRQKQRQSPTQLFEQINPDVPNVVTFAETYEDLFFESIAWWRVLRFDQRGFPAAAEHISPDRVHVAGVGGLPTVTGNTNYPIGGVVYIDGRPVQDREVIRFDSPNPPLLIHGARAIRTCLRLDRTASMYADEPLPLGYFTPREPGRTAEKKEQIEEYLDKWEEARRRRAWGYVGGAWDAKVLQFNAEQIQLADQRQHAVLEIARAAGVDPEDLGVSTTSRTYQNAEQRRMDLLDFTLMAYASAVEQRLSMRDVLPAGFEAKVNFDAFLRADTKTRMETHEIGIRSGVETVNEARALEDRPAIAGSGQMESPREIAELIQKIYLGVGVVLTAEEAREIANRAGAGLSGALPAAAPAASNGSTQG